MNEFAINGFATVGREKFAFIFKNKKRILRLMS